MKSPLQRLFTPTSLCLSVVLLVVVRTIVQRFAFADDFALLWDGRVDEGLGTFNHLVNEGRYLGIITQVVPFNFLGTIDSLAILRFAAVMGWVYFSYTLNRYLRCLNPKLNSVILCIVLTLLLPFFWQSITFAVMWFVSWIFSLSLKSYLLMQRKTIGLKLSGLFLLFCISFSSIQYVFLPLIFMGLKAIAGKQDNRVILKEFLKLVSSIFCVIAINFLTILVVKFLFPSNSGRLGVTDLAQLMDKLFWFFSRPMVLIFRPFLVDSPSPIVAIPWFILFSGFFAISISKSAPALESRFLRVILLYVIVISPSAYLLVWNQNQIEFRLVAVSSFGAILFTLVGAHVYLSDRGYLDNLRSLISSIYFILIFVVLQVSLSRHEFLRLEPFETKDKFIRESLELCSESQIRNSILVKLPKDFPKRSLLGDYSVGTDLEMPWVPIANVGLLVNEIYPSIQEENVAFQETIADRSLSDEKASCRIELSSIVQSNYSKWSKGHI